MLIKSLPSQAMATGSFHASSLIEADRKLSFPEIDNHFAKAQKEVPFFLKEGNAFDLELTKNYFKQLQTRTKVVEVPNWLYGSWKSNKQTQDFIHIFGEGSNNLLIEVKVETTDMVGDIEGADGKVYSIVIPGAMSEIKRNANLIEYQISLSEERNSAMGKFICHDLSLRLQVNPITKEIIKSFQVESEKHYRPTFRAGSIITDGWLKSFDENGKAQSISHSSSNKKLIERQKLVNLEELNFEKAYQQRQ